MKYVCYFGYGSNLNLDVMKERIGEWKSVKRAVLRDYKFVFRPKPGVVVPVIVPSRGDRVLGAVYLITEEQLEEIDKYERPYSTEKVEVETEDGRIEAVAYVFDVEKFLKRVTNYRNNWIEGLKQHHYGNGEISEVEKIMDESIRDIEEKAKDI